MQDEVFYSSGQGSLLRELMNLYKQNCLCNWVRKACPLFMWGIFTKLFQVLNQAVNLIVPQSI